VTVIATEAAMRTRRDRWSATFVDRYLQARRALVADAPGRAVRAAERERSDERAIEAVTRAIRASSRQETA
jgi:hypothetical protein